VKKESDETILLRQAMYEIRHQRQELNVLRAQMFVVEAFHAAALGRPGGMGMTEDLAWRIERHLQEANDKETVS
jgi:hypothetical protein